MKKKLKILLGTLLVGVGVILPLGSVQAVEVLQPACDNAPTSTLCDESNKSGGGNKLYGKDSLLAKATSLVAILVGVAAVIMIIIGGFKYVLSNGDSNAINSAKNTIIYAVVGLVVAVVAQAIVSLIINKL